MVKKVKKISEDSESSWSDKLSWTKHSDLMLSKAEKSMLSFVKTPYKGSYVDIGSVVGRHDKIWTITMNLKSTNTPIVMVHGMGAGLAFYCTNFDAIAASRPVYAIDLLGFARSSRPKFSTDPQTAEEQWVQSLEDWRKKMDIGQFILLGHSLGGFLSTAYSMKYPERIRHLILADPWGFPDRKEHPVQKVPLWVRAVATVANPLCALRAVGPAGKWLVQKSRPDIAKKYEVYIQDANDVIPEYIYQCNSATPSGEAAFYTLTTGLGWAKNPMCHRLDKFNSAVPVTLIYGTESWVYKTSGDIFHEWGKKCSNVQVKAIEGSTHHVYLDRPDVFNKFVVEACFEADQYNPLPHLVQSQTVVTRQDSESVPKNVLLRRRSIEDLMQTIEDTKENTEVFQQNKLERAKRLSKHKSLENLQSYEDSQSNDDIHTRTILKQRDIEHSKQITSEFFRKIDEDDLKDQVEQKASGESSKEGTIKQSSIDGLKRAKHAILQKIKINGIVKSVPNNLGTVAVS